MQFFFMHIGKTAGSALNQALRTKFGEAFIDHVERRPKWWEDAGRYIGVSGHLHFPHFKKVIDERNCKFITILREPIAQLKSHLNWVKILGQNPSLRENTPPKVLELSDELSKIDLNDAFAIRKFMTGDMESVLRVSLFDNCQSRYFLDGPNKKKFDTDSFCDAVRSFQQFDFVGISEDIADIEFGVKQVLEIDGDFSLPYVNVQAYDRSVDRERFREVLDDWIGYDCALYELARMRHSRLRTHNQ